MKSTHICLKPAVIDDIPLILQFIQELATYEKLRHEATATEQQLRDTLFNDKPYAEVIIAYLNEHPVGFALFFHNYSTFLGKPGMYLEDLYVQPLARSYGVGKHLLIYLAQLAQARDCGRIEWSVLDWNQPAIGFYHRIGAKPMSDWTTYRLDQAALQQLAENGTVAN